MENLVSEARVTKDSHDSPGRIKDRFPSALSNRSVWIFDLDNTLYPAENELFSQIDMRMGDFISNLLGVDLKQAKVIQKDYFAKYGTTLAGLMDHHGVDPDHFMDFVHDIDVTAIKPDAELAEGLRRLPGQKYVFTNGSGKHARRILSRLNIEQELAGVFDLSHSGYIPKPQPEAYLAFVDHFGIQAEDSVMIDDMARNLVPASAMGMATVWLQTGNKWGELGHVSSSIDMVIKSLGSWLGNPRGGSNYD